MSSGLKKGILGIIVIGCIVAIFAIMNNNKKKNQEKAKNVEILTVVPVNVEQAKMEAIDENLAIVGSVSANTEVSVVSEAQGKAVAVNFNIGDRVSAGKELVRVDDELKKAALMTAEANYEKAKKDYDRYVALYKEKSVNEAQVDAAKQAFAISDAALITAKRQLADTKIKSPISGVISAKSVEPGSYLQVNTPVCYIVDINTVKVKLNVPEKDAFKMKVGDDVDVSTEVYGNKVFKGKIKNISSKSDEAHTFPIEVALQNSSTNPLKAGMFARVDFKSVVRNGSISISRNALVGSIRNPQVYVVEGDKAVLRNVVIGAQTTDKLEVLQGVNQGEQVVNNGQINLKNNVSVKIVK